MQATEVRLSIVIASWNGAALLGECLTSLISQVSALEDEVIVVGNFDLAASKNRFKSLEFVHFVELPASATVPELRARGVELASGNIVALLEDHCTFDPQWSSQLKKAHEAHSVVGGCVENTVGQRGLNWAVYFYDYGKYMLPDVPRVVTSLSGNNVSYKRRVLEDVKHVYRDGFYEIFVHEELQKRGHNLYLMPSATIYHNKNYSLGSSIRDCYNHGRLFAALRFSGSSFLQRAARGASSLLLPLVLSSRIVVRTLRKKRHIKELLSCFPYLLLLMTVWSYGELCGYLRGEGSSVGQWR